jgi:hypothetical protein
MADAEKHKFILVLGHESSGTRLIADTIAQAAGFDYDDGRHVVNENGQVVDTFLTKTIHHWWLHPEDVRYDKPRITRRSLPHGGVGNADLKNQVQGRDTSRAFLDPLPFIEGLKLAGYDVRIVLTVRDRNVAIRSKCREHTQDDFDLAVAEIDRALAIMQAVAARHDNCFICSYEALMALGGAYLDKLYAFLDVKSGHQPALRDGNAKYFERSRVRPLKSVLPSKVGIATRQNDHQWGGDLRALRSARDGVEQMGIDVRMARTAAELTDCDFVFLSNTCMDQRANAKVLQDRDIPFGLFGFHEDFQFYYPQSMGFSDYISMCLQGLDTKGLKLRMEDLWENPNIFNYFNHEVPKNTLVNLPVMRAASVCVAASHREARTMQRDCPMCNTAVVFWNIPLVSQRADYSDAFLKLTGLAKGEYLLQVGRLETRKNQLATVLATRNLDMPLVLVTTKGYQKTYDLLVVNAAAKYRKAPTLIVSEEYPTQVVGGATRIIQMPNGQRLSEACLRSAYENCGLHVHPAFWEAPGYTYLEAAKIGVHTIASEWGTLRDYCEFGGNDPCMGDRFTYVCPYDLAQIERAVRENFGRAVDKNLEHPIFERTERDVGKDLVHCLVDYGT